MERLTEESFLEFHPDGSAFHTIISRSPRQVTEAMMEKFNKGMVMNLKRAFPCPETGGSASLIFTTTDRYAVARLPHLKLNCHYRLIGDKVLVPVFIAKDSDTSEYIAAAPVWKVPDDMVLLFATRVYNFSDLRRQPATSPDQSCWLIAYDKDKRAYKLPISNVYDDCAVCMGQFDGAAPTVSEAFSRALKQFGASDWNADLAGGTGNSDSLFRFKTKKDETESLPPTAPWTSLCTVISTPMSTMFGGLL